jgi:hypothetical protein
MIPMIRASGMIVELLVFLPQEQGHENRMAFICPGGLPVQRHGSEGWISSVNLSSRHLCHQGSAEADHRFILD